MAVKAKGQITLSAVVDVKAVYWFYLLQSSTLVAPNKPNSFPPASSWDDTEPKYTEGSTNSLYIVECTVFCDDTFEYSEVSLSSSYEAAKVAYNKAANAQGTANDVANNLQNNYYTKTETDAAIKVESDKISSTVSEVRTEIDNLEIGGRNLVPVSRINGVVEVATTEEFELRDVWASTFITNSDLVEILEPATEYTARYNLELIERTDVPTKFDMMVGFLIYSAAHSTWVSLATQMPENAEIGDTKTYQVTFTTPSVWNDESLICYSRRWTTDGASPVGFDAFKVTDFKIEKGNKATDWTPAPEDVAADTAAAKTEASTAQATADSNAVRLTSAESVIEQLVDSISMIITDENGTSLFEQTSDGWSFNLADISNNLDSAQTALGNLENSLSDTDSAVDVLREALGNIESKTAYINIGTDDNGNPCIELGKQGNDFIVRITNEAVDFFDGTNKVAYISNKSLYITRAVVTGELQIGSFVLGNRPNGNFGLQYKGGAE